MKKRTVRVFAIALAALMVLSLLPLAAYAQETEAPEEFKIPGFELIDGRLVETEHIYTAEVAEEGYLVDPSEPGDCQTPAKYWRSCGNVNPLTEERCGYSAGAAYEAEMQQMMAEMNSRLAAGEKKENLTQIAAMMAAEIEAKYESYKFEALGDHQWVEVEAQPATCGSEGCEAFRYCEVCGAGRETAVIIPATGEHTWGEYETVTEATCGEDGLEVRTCSVCEETEEREIPATGEHDFVNGFCTVCNAEDPNYVQPVEKTTEGTEGNTTEGTEGTTIEGTEGNTTEGTEGNTTEGTEGNTTEGTEGNTTEGTEGNTTEGTEGNTTEGTEGNTTEGTEGNTTEGTEGNTTEGNTTEGAEGNTTEGTEGNTTEGTEGNTTEGTEGNTTEQTENDQPKVETYTGEVNVAQTAASADVVDSFTNAAWEYLGLTSENTVGVSVQNVTPYKEDGTELSDEEIPEEGIDFEMDIPEGFDPENQDIEIYHRNKDGVWEKMQIVDINLEDNKITVRKVRSFSPFALTVKRLDDQIAIVSRPVAFGAGPEFTVTFDPDGGTPVAALSTTDGKLTVPAASECTKPGYTLVNWSEEGGNYLPGKEYTFTKDTTLKAKWAKNVKIIFDPNAITAEGSMPPQDKDADGNPLYEGLYVELNPNQYTNGDEAFKNWYTNKSGTGGTAYDDKAEVKLTDVDLTLYAQWTHTHTVTFKPGTEGTGTESTQKFAEGTTAALTTIEKLGFTSTTAEFLNWKDQDGKTYTDGQSIKPTKDLTLTAQWDKKYTVTFYGSGGSTKDGETTATQTILESKFTAAGETGVALDANPFVRDGYVFTGWCKNNDNVPTIEDKDTVKADAFTSEQLALYACWADKVTVTFDPNYSTSASRKTQDVPQNVETPLDKNTYVRDGYLFAGWYKNKNCTGTALESIKTSNDVTLYAKWLKVTIRDTTNPSDEIAYVGDTITAYLLDSNGKSVNDSTVTYQWYAQTASGAKMMLSGETSKTLTRSTIPTSTTGVKTPYVYCVVTKGEYQAASNLIELKDTLDVYWIQDIINDGNFTAWPSSANNNYAYHTQVGAIGGVTAGMTMEYTPEGSTTAQTRTITANDVKSGYLPTTAPGTYVFKQGSIKSDPITIYDWYTVGFYYTGSTSYSSTGTATSGSGRATMTRTTSTSSSGAMPASPTLATATDTQRDTYDIMKLSSSVDNVWVIKRSSETPVILTVTPSSGSYANVSLNGRRVDSFGNARTTTNTTSSSSSTTNASRSYTVNRDANGYWIRMPMMYSIVFYSATTSPRTADESNLGLWSALCMISLTGAAVILTETRKRRKNTK